MQNFASPRFFIKKLKFFVARIKNCRNFAALTYRSPRVGNEVLTKHIEKTLC